MYSQRNSAFISGGYCYRTSTISESIRHLENRTVAPRLILAASYKRHNTSPGYELEAFTGHPLVLGRPVLLLEYGGNTTEVSQYYQQGIAAYHTKPETDGDWKALLTAIRSFWFVQARLLPQ